MQTRITWSWILRPATFFQVRLNGHWYIAKMKVGFKWECTHNQSQGRVFIPRNLFLGGGAFDLNERKGNFYMTYSQVFGCHEYFEEGNMKFLRVDPRCQVSYHFSFIWPLHAKHGHATNLLVFFYTSFFFFRFVNANSPNPTYPNQPHIFSNMWEKKSPLHHS